MRGSFSGMHTAKFSPALQHDLAAALNAYVDAPGTPTIALLRAATVRACAEAHALSMSPEAMVIALRGFYTAISVGAHGAEERRRAAYDRLLSGCIEVYFATQPPMH